MVKNLLALGVTLVIMLVVGEVILRLGFPVEDPYRARKQGMTADAKYIESQFAPYQQLELLPEPELPGMPAKARFSTDNLGFRGPDIVQPKPPSEFRIFMVGGSTTECLYLDDTMTTAYVLESFLAGRLPHGKIAKVYNAGKSGDRSYDHLAMIGQRIVHLQPDMIIVFCGINDLTAAIYNADYLHFPSGAKAELTFFAQVKLLLTEFQIPRRLYYVYRSIFRPKSDVELLTAIGLKSDYEEKVALRKSQPVSDDFPRIDLIHYGNNLISIVGLARAHGVRVVMMTQATTWNSKTDPGIADRHWASYRNGVTYREDMLDSAMNLYNGIMREAGAAMDVPVFETALMIPKTRVYFYDDCHFNMAGARKAGELLGAFLLENNLFW